MFAGRSGWRPSGASCSYGRGRGIAESSNRRKRPGFRQDFKKSFLRGLGALTPTLVTIIILVWLYQFIDRNIATYINRMNVWLLSRTGYPADGSEELRRMQEELGHTGIPPEEQQRLVQQKRAGLLAKRAAYDAEANKSGAAAAALRAEMDRLYQELATLMGRPGRVVDFDEARIRWWEAVFLRWHLQITGFIVAVVLVYFLGFFFATYLGRGLWRMLEALMKRTPLVKQIYPYVKQITDFVLSEQKVEFRRVVAVQYPRRGIWSLGFVTGAGLRTVREATALDLVTVFVPSSPTPVTGYVILVRRQEIIDLPIGVDSALRFVVSGGVIMPPGEVPPQLDTPAVVDADPETVTIEDHAPQRRLPPERKKPDKADSTQ